MKGWCLPLLAAPCMVLAQSGLSQARLEDDCLQRLQPLVPRKAKVERTGFSALGHNAGYWVVAYRFDATLANGQREARCTYRRDGQWVLDDAAAFKLARELQPLRPPRD